MLATLVMLVESAQNLQYRGSVPCKRLRTDNKLNCYLPAPQSGPESYPTDVMVEAGIPEGLRACISQSKHKTPSKQPVP